MTVVPPSPPPPGENLVPEGPDGGEAFHCFSEVGEQRELRGVIQLLQVPAPGSRVEWLGGHAPGSAWV